MCGHALWACWEALPERFVHTVPVDSARHLEALNKCHYPKLTKSPNTDKALTPPVPALVSSGLLQPESSRPRSL